MAGWGQDWLPLAGGLIICQSRRLLAACCLLLAAAEMATDTNVHEMLAAGELYVCRGSGSAGGVVEDAGGLLRG